MQQTGSLQDFFTYDISGGTLNPVTLPPQLPPQYPNLPDRVATTRTNYILPSPDSNIYLYERCNGQQVSPSGEICQTSTDFVIYNLQSQQVLKILDDAVPALMRGYEASYTHDPAPTKSLPAWSSGGRYLAYQRFADGLYDYFHLRVYDLNLSQYQNIQWINAVIDTQRALQWSKVGNKLAFWIMGRIGESLPGDNQDTLRTLVIYDADSNTFTTTNQPFNLNPANSGKVITWSPESQNLVFVDQLENLVRINASTGTSSILDTSVNKVIVWKIYCAWSQIAV